MLMHRSCDLVTQVFAEGIFYSRLFFCNFASVMACLACNKVGLQILIQNQGAIAGPTPPKIGKLIYNLGCVIVL